MLEQAEARRQTGQGNSNGVEFASPQYTANRAVPIKNDYHTIRRSSYEAVLNDSLDDLAVKAVRLSYLAGQLADVEDVPTSRRDAMRAMAEGAADRLNERVRAYEMILRTTLVPERGEWRR